MSRNRAGSFFARLRQKLFNWRINVEIHDRIFAHHRGERDYGYPFGNREQMKALTEQLDVQPLLDAIEEHIRNMPDAYGEAFRYIMHRDLHERFHTYERLARQGVEPKTCDPHYVATRA
jgi:hypothetical protein